MPSNSIDFDRKKHKGVEHPSSNKLKQYAVTLALISGNGNSLAFNLVNLKSCFKFSHLPLTQLHELSFINLLILTHFLTSYLQNASNVYIPTYLCEYPVSKKKRNEYSLGRAFVRYYKEFL